MRRGAQTVVLGLGLALAGCITAKDATRDDARVDEGTSREVTPESKGRTCGAEAKGDIVLIDSRTGGPVTCMDVTVSWEPMTCARGGDCPSELVYKGFTNARGQVAASGAFSKARLVAVADGFSPSYLSDASLTPNRVLELELAPDEGFWLKVLDGEGNYLQDVLVTFKQADAVLAQLRTNVLANVFFTQRHPFSGQPVTVEAPGYQSVTVGGVEDLGDDGHTLTLRK